MRCAWNELLSILPSRYRKEVDFWGKDSLREIRLRINAPPELIMRDSRLLGENVKKEDLDFVLNAASEYSPWTASSVRNGYLTAPGGHRIGICGEAICPGGNMEGFRSVRSLCIRVSRDYPGIAAGIPHTEGSILIIGAPGWGKTTLLRDLVRIVSQMETVAVVDERKELFPPQIQMENRMDVISGCPKPIGIGLVLRTMGPQCIAVDEITEEQDTIALMNATNCGVRLIATAHASSLDEFRKRKVYQSLVKNRIFQTVIILHRDKTYHVERMEKCTANGSEQF